MKKETMIIALIAIVFALVSCKAEPSVPAQEIAPKASPSTYVSQHRSSLELVTETYTLDPASNTITYDRESSIFGHVYSYTGTYTLADGALTIHTTLEENMVVDADGNLRFSLEGHNRVLSKNEAGYYTDGHVRFIAAAIGDGLSFTLKNNLLCKGTMHLNADGSYTLTGQVTFVHDAILGENLVIDGRVFSK
jgi:hypothetical protein